MNQPPGPSQETSRETSRELRHESSGQLRRNPILGVIADDVTGATDIALNLTQGGMRVVQVVGAASAQMMTTGIDADAIVVALKSRSMAAQDAAALSRHALECLIGAGVSRVYFKYCSTFDSTPRGNIGPVADELMRSMHVPQTVFCPAFPRAGRTVYRGHLFVGDALLNESGMQNHPLTPMTDANLVRVLAAQSNRAVGLLAAPTIAQSASACRQRLAELERDQVPFVICDACDDGDLQTLADACATMPLVTGGSGLARFLPDAYRKINALTSGPTSPALPSVVGRNLILAGSCSIATNRQVDSMRSRCPTWQIDVAAVVDNADATLQRIVQWAGRHVDDQTLLIASTSSPAAVAELQTKFGVGVVADAIERMMGRIAKTFVDEHHVRRLVLAGGETSGAVVRELGVQLLSVGPEICAGVPWTQTIGDDPVLAIAMKSGNFGDVDFFGTALEMLR